MATLLGLIRIGERVQASKISKPAGHHAPSDLSLRASPKGADIHRERTHLASNLPLVGGSEYSVPERDAPVDNDGTHVGSLHRVRDMGHRIVERHQVILIQINDHYVGALTWLKGAHQVIQLERPGSADRRHLEGR